MTSLIYFKYKLYVHGMHNNKIIMITRETCMLSIYPRNLPVNLQRVIQYILYNDEGLLVFNMHVAQNYFTVR